MTPMPYDKLRYRLQHKHSGQVVELSAFDLDTACYMVRWKIKDVYWINLGAMRTLKEPKYVRVIPSD